VERKEEEQEEEQEEEEMEEGEEEEEEEKEEKGVKNKTKHTHTHTQRSYRVAVALPRDGPGERVEVQSGNSVDFHDAARRRQAKLMRKRFQDVKDQGEFISFFFDLGYVFFWNRQ
jgi:hypothetical protein